MQAEKAEQGRGGNAAAYNWHGVKCAETPDGVSVTITGAAFDTLKEITRTFNQWDGGGWTPADLIWRECVSANAALITLGETRPDCDAGETLAGSLLDEYRDAPDAGELAAAFRAAHLV